MLGRCGALKSAPGGGKGLEVSFVAHQAQATTTVAAALTTRDVAMLISSEIRREILLALAGQEKDVSTLARELDLDIRTISHFLVQLKQRRLVLVRRDSRRHLYRLSELAHTRRENGCAIVILAVPGKIRLELLQCAASPKKRAT